MSSAMDDEELFLKYIKNMGLPPGEKENTDDEPDHDSEDLRLFLKAMQETSSPEVDHGRRGEQSHRVLCIKLPKNKTIPVADTLDLHGRRVDTAIQTLNHFIKEAYDTGIHAVLVITGKGKNSPGGSVLRPAVETWIRNEGCSHIHAYGHASRFQGGQGAFVIYLKKT